jgi:NADPH:quinone reductase-like Zn-dependent oxidoreductase
VKAAIVRDHGGPKALEVVKDWPVPAIGEGDVLLKVKAASLNYHDVFTRRGMPGIKLNLPVVPALDIAGEIAEIGPGVTGFAMGDRVLVDPINRVEGGLMGETVDGGLQEYARVRGPPPPCVSAASRSSFAAYVRPRRAASKSASIPRTRCCSRAKPLAARLRSASGKARTPKARSTA